MIRNTKTSRSLALMATVSAIGLLGVAGSARASQTIDNATVTVPGTFASPLVVNNGLFVGVNGTGTLDINNGGVVSTTNCASAQLGQFAGSSGTILIHDPGSHFDNATCGIFVGMAGNGTLTISNGGVLDTHGGSQVGQGVNSVSVATVTGAGSQWNLSALAIGLSGHGTVNVLAGGALTQTACGAVDVGSNNNSVGVINVGGAGSHWANGGCVFHLGDSGSGALNVTAGGVVDGVAGIEVANTQGAGSGSLTISGANSKVTSTGAVDIGEFNVGTLAISGGGVLTDTQGNLGDLNGSSGSATVDGVGSLWTNTSSLGVGRNGAGALSITNGAVVTANSGFTSGSTTGAVTVSGAGSKLTVATSLSLGDRGTSTVSINNGGVVSDASGVAGVNTNAIANITIDGAGSAWNNSTTLDLGNGFNSAVNLVVQNSGQLSDNSAVLEAGNVTVNGPSSVWTNTTTLRVGGSGAGILTINGLANVTAPGGTTLGAGSSSSGVISIGGAVGQAATSPGTLQTPTVVLGAGNGAQGTLNFNHVSVNYLFAPLISGPGKVNVTSGLTIFSADNTYTGLTTIAPGATLQLGNAGATGSIAGNVTDNGTLIFIRSNALSYGGAIGGTGALTVFGSNSVITLSGTSNYTGATHVDVGTLLVNGVLGNTPVTVGSAAFLGGSGTIGGTVNVANSGILLGVGGQTLTTGAVTMAPGAVFNVTLGAPSATRLLNVNGDLTLDGTLNITNAGGFGAGLYRLIDYTGNLTDNTLILGALPNGVQANSLTIQTSVAHQVNLLFGAAAVATPFWNGTIVTPAGSVVGGTGTWKLGPNNWTDAAGANSGPWDGTIGIFAGTAGAVTVDNSAGQVSAQTLQFAVNGYTVSGGALTLNGASTPTIRVGDGTAAGANYTATVNSVIQGSSFIKTDLGTLVLTAANTYSGTTLFFGGWVSVSADANLGAAGNGWRFATNGGLLITSSFANNRPVLMAGPGEIRTTAGTTLTLGGAITGSGSLIKSGAGTLILGGVSAYNGDVTVAAGRLAATGTLAANSVSVQSGASLAGSGSIAGPVTVANGATLVGVAGQTLTTGALTLNQTSVFDAALGAPGATGLINVGGALTLDGQLNVTDAGGFGQGLYRLIDYTGALTDNGMILGALPAGFQLGQFSIQTSVAHQVNLVIAGPAATPFWNGSTTTATGTVVGGTGTWKNGPTNWTDAAGANAGTWDGNFGIFAGAAGVVTVDNSAGAVTANGAQFAVDGYSVTGAALTLTGATPTLRVGDGTAAGAGYTATINAVLTGSNGLIKTDLGTLILNGANTYTGGTTINGGAVSVAADTGLGGAGGVTFNGGALVATATFLSNRAFNFAGPGEIRTTPVASLNLQGVLSGNGAFSKTGAGILILAGASTYNGAATVAAGTLRMNGSTAGSFAVQSGATLGGAGSTTGSVTVAGGGTLLGIAGQTLTTGALTLNNTSIIQTSLGAPSNQALFHVNGALTLDGVLNISNTGGFGLGLYRLIDYTGSLTDNGVTLGVIPFTVQASQLTVQTAINGQVNLIVAAPVAPPILFWNGAVTSATGSVVGGTGTWRLGPTNWTDANGAVSAGWNSDFGVFAGAAGVVTLDGSGGGISANGLQFAVGGYTVGGAALALTGAAPTLRVGDGTAAGAGYTATIGSVLTGSNGLIKTDLGTLVLTGANTFSGGAMINGGFVSVAADANLGAAANAVTLNGGGLQASASFNSNRNVAFAGAGEIRTASGATLTLTNALTGAAAFAKSGAGTLILTGVSSYSGAASVAAGTLRVDGVLPGTVTVQNGGRLQGTGSVGATSVQSGGTLAAGDSIGTLNVSGPVTFAAGSNLEVELNAQGQSDLVHATGNASVQGGTVAAVAAAGPYTIGRRYTIVTSDTAETGTFASLSGGNLNMLFLKLALSYDAKHAYLDVVRNAAAFCSVAQTANQCAAANGADSLGQGKAVFDAIANLNDPAVARAAFDSVSGEVGADAKGVALEDSRFVRDGATGRLRQALATDDGHGAWGQVFGSWGDAATDGNAADLHRSTSGILLGGDMLGGEGWRVGGLGGYSHATFDAPARASSGETTSYHLAVYGGAKRGPLGVRFGAAYAWHTVQTARAAAFPGFADQLSADYRARSGQLFGEVGYQWGRGVTTLEPYAGLAYVTLHTDGFTEAGAAAALTSQTSSQSVTFTNLGARAATSGDWDGTRIGLHGSVAWRRAFGSVTPMSRFVFAAGGSAFDIAGLPIARDAALIDVGADVSASDRVKLSVSYSGVLARGASDHGAKATISVAF